MTRMTGPDCVVMCNLINTHTHTFLLEVFIVIQISLILLDQCDDRAVLRDYVEFNK